MGCTRIKAIAPRQKEVSESKSVFMDWTEACVPSMEDTYVTMLKGVSLNQTSWVRLIFFLDSIQLSLRKF